MTSLSLLCPKDEVPVEGDEFTDVFLPAEESFPPASPQP